MPFCPNCGSYVSPGTNVCSCGTSFGYSRETEKEKQPTEFEKQQEEKRKIRNGYYQKAKKSMDEGNYLKAIEYIDRIPDMSQSGFYLKAKARAYYFAGMYEEALIHFRQSLEQFRGKDAYVIFEWIGDTLNEMNRFDEAVEAYESAIDIINEEYERSINFFRSERWMGYERIEHACASSLEERNERLSDVRGRIEYSKKLKSQTIRKKLAENVSGSQEELLTKIGKNNLITITGTYFYDNPEFEKGMEFKLVKEEDNEFDSDAIAVYLNDVKVGYAANSERTCCHLTSKAGSIQIPEIAYAEYVLHFAHRYHIARIIR